MSFGFSVGDFIAAIEIANKIRKEFAEAPSQFKAILDEVGSLSIVLQDIDVKFPKQGVNDDQKRDLESIEKGCRNVLAELQRILDKYSELGSESGSVGKRVKRVWKRLNWKPEDIRELRSRIIANIGLLNAFQERFTRDNVVRLVRHQEGQDRRTVLDWITPIDYSSQQNGFLARRQEGTGQWLIDSDEFQKWLETAADNPILFCPGIPGAGKTILTSIVVDELTTRFYYDETIGIIYLYCDFQRQDEQKVDALLASLLKQLVEAYPSLPSSVEELYSWHKTKRTRPSLKEISRVLQDVATLFSRVFIVIDALDECQVSDGSRARFLSEIFEFQKKTGANLFATSRMVPEIEEKFKGSIKLEIRAMDKDVQHYVAGQMDKLPSFVASTPDLQNEFKATIAKVADGMFLLAQLHMNALAEQPTHGDIELALQNLPIGLDETYKLTMLRIENQGDGFRNLAKKVLSWVIHAERPLSTIELQHAVAVIPRQPWLDRKFIPTVEMIGTVCAGLVIIENQSDIVRLVHYTAQEYFDRHQSDWFPSANTDITIICVTYLSFTVFGAGFCETDDEFEERLQLNPLYKYAAQNWGNHAREASVLGQDVILSFLKCEANVEASIQALLAKDWVSSDLNYSQNVPQKMTQLHLAAYFGIQQAVDILLKTHSVDPRDSYGWTPLIWATINGHIDIVKLLLSNGANADSKWEDSRTPLSFAIEYGHNAIAKLLLENEIDVNSQDTRNGNTPLSLAAKHGRETIVDLLLIKGAKADLTSADCRTPLSFAAEEGHETIVDLLLKKGAEVDSKSADSRTPLSFAADQGYETIVDLLLIKGAEADSKSDDCRTPLSFAADHGYETIVDLLLIKGAEADSTSADCRTPLSFAAGRGYETIVDLLLKKGAKADSMSVDYRTPLSFAAKHGYKAIVKLLLTKGVDPDSKSANGRTPFSFAAENGHETIIDLLLTEGVEADSRESGGWTPLRYAMERSHESVVNLLISKCSVDLNSEDEDGRTVLWFAARNGWSAIVERILQYDDITLDKGDKCGETPLMCAAENEQLHICQQLLKKGAREDVLQRYGVETISPTLYRYRLLPGFIYIHKPK